MTENLKHSDFNFFISPNISIQDANKKAEKIVGLFKILFFRISLIKKAIKNILISKSTKIQSAFRGYLARVNIRTNILINYILKKREKSASLIQKNYRNYFYVREYNRILQKEKDHYSIYFLISSDNRKVSIQISLSKDEPAEYFFEYCKARKIYVVYIPKHKIKPLVYQCCFIVDGLPVIDSRFPTSYSNGNFYNKIDFKTLNKDPDYEDEDDEELDKNIFFQNQSKYFNLKNIDFFRKKVESDIKDELTKKTTTSSFFNRNQGSGLKKSGSNVSLSNLRKAEINRTKKLQYVKSVSELLKKAPIKPILRNNKWNKKIEDDLRQLKDEGKDITEELKEVKYRKENPTAFSSTLPENKSDVPNLGFSFSNPIKIKKKVTLLNNHVEVYEGK